MKVGPELLSQLEFYTLLVSHKRAKEGLADMSILFNLLKAYGILDKISFDPTLARYHLRSNRRGECTTWVQS